METKPTEPGFYWGRARPGINTLASAGWEPVHVMEYGGRLVVWTLGDEREVDLDDVELGERLVHGG